MEDVTMCEDSYCWSETHDDWIDWYFLEQMGVEAEVYED